MAQAPHDPRIPEARVRPTGAGPRARAMGGDVQQWVAARALVAGRFAGRMLPPILAITMIAGVIIALGISVGHRERTNSYDFEFDYEQFRLQQEMYQQQLDSYLRSQEYLLQLELYQNPSLYEYQTNGPTIYAPYDVKNPADDDAPASSN
jgi:hypothetical protein